MKKFCYKCRKQVAEKRLRIKGRFVTRQQAFEILGITYDELKGNDIIQRLLESHANMIDFENGGASLAHPMMMTLQLNTLVESEGDRKQIKIRNFQALIDENYNHNSRPALPTTQSRMLFGTKGGEAYPGVAQEDLLRQIQLNLRISTAGETPSVFGGGNSVTKVLISGDTHSSSFGTSSNFDDQMKMSLNSLRMEGYVQPLFKVERLIDPKKI